MLEFLSRAQNEVESRKVTAPFWGQVHSGFCRHFRDAKCDMTEADPGPAGKAHSELLVIQELSVTQSIFVIYSHGAMLAVLLKRAS